MNNKHYKTFGQIIPYIMLNNTVKEFDQAAGNTILSSEAWLHVLKGHIDSEILGNQIAKNVAIGLLSVRSTPANFDNILKNLK